MPATVLVSPSARSGLRAVLIIAAVIALLIPIVASVAYGASRLDYTKVESSQDLPAETTDFRFDLDTGASISVRTDDVAAPAVTLTGTGPRDNVPQLRVDEIDGASVISIEDKPTFENAKLELTVPRATSKDTNIDFAGGLGEVGVTGEFNEVKANADAGSIDLNGTFDRVQTSTQWGQTEFRGTFGTIEAKSEVGTIDGTDLRVRDRLDVQTTTGTIDFDLSNDMVPTAGISLSADEGTVDLQLPRLELVKDNMTAATANDGDDAEVKDLFYRIDAKSDQGQVDLAKDLEKYKSGKDSKEAEGKAIIPVSVTTDTGAVSIDQN
ncbi:MULTISPECIES: DUF4097 family beta strand repeat-containing protein [unclassified Brevibacterium]|uniref:DUF4097 family beta strand repeat-containing protein n=1 Tax=unclassified Brevibacterium TaxID=2614124 RepID=UPI0010F46764|nr:MULTISPECIES: DUF4097 family beta strand repeat-containing protein [unclassified Brevibacterium]MCM1011199.1 DUF4097 domain-containing protein [Brevibacterium sp. XM4083]